MKTLLLYTSKKGATKVCADKLKNGIKGEVEMVTLKEANKVKLDDYQKIIIGSPIYAGMIDKEIKAYIVAHEAELKDKKVFLYLCCMDGSQKQTYLENNLSAEQIGLFDATACCGGAFYFSKMNFFEKFIIKKIANSEKGQKDFKQKVDGKTDIEMYAEKEIQALVAQINK